MKIKFADSVYISLRRISVSFLHHLLPSLDYPDISNNNMLLHSTYSSSTTTIVGFITAYVLSITSVSSHSVFMFPKPYSVQHCNLPECTAPCPRVWGAGVNKAQNAPWNSVIWKRGQLVDVGWHKNNHYGGFVRHSLVPVRHMYESNWHTKTAFEWGCFSQGYHKCKIKVGKKWDKLRFQRACGTDARSMAFRTKFRIPRVFKDGNYVLATVWIGGISDNQKRGEIMFPDYHNKRKALRRLALYEKCEDHRGCATRVRTRKTPSSAQTSFHRARSAEKMGGSRGASA